MKIEMNIRLSFGRYARYDCRIIVVVVVVVVTGKRGHRVYVSRDDVAEEPRMSQFRAARVVAPGATVSRCRVGCHHRLCTTPVAERREEERGGGGEGGFRFRDRARIRESPGSSLFSPFDVWTARKMKPNRAGLNGTYDGSKNKTVATCHREQRSAIGNFVTIKVA